MSFENVDSREGLALFLIFVGAALIVTGIVVILALVNSWWMLGFAIGVHAVMTTAVWLAIANALDGGGHSRVVQETVPAERARSRRAEHRRAEPMAA
jgi:hypothetical protein